jgi:phenylalanyl-tRNA synthetase beta chain
MICDLAGGTIASDVIDIYPAPEKKKEVNLEPAYLKKLSGKAYPGDKVKTILESLGFEQASGNSWLVPYHKRDVGIAADLVEEILRIDGLDNIPIPTAITITPAVDQLYRSEALKEKTSGLLAGSGFSEILTNSITNSKYLTEAEASTAVKMINNLSSELDVMRSSMIHTALEVVAFNHNRKQPDLRLFEFGKTYRQGGRDEFHEEEHLCLYVTGSVRKKGWKHAEAASDIYYLRGMAEAVLESAGVQAYTITESESPAFEQALEFKCKDRAVALVGGVARETLQKFDIKTPVYFADIYWEAVEEISEKNSISYKEVPRFPAVERDLSMVVPKGVRYALLRESIMKLRLDKMQDIKLFDLFESEKIGAGKKSLALNFVFQDPEKTLTDKEIDAWMNRIITTLEKEGAEIRK